MTQYILTDVKIRKIKPDAGKRIEVWDSKFPGFGVRIAPTGTKSFVLLYRQNGRSRRMTLGRYPALSLAEARQMARDALNRLAHEEPAKEPEQQPSKAQRFDETVDMFAAKHCNRHNKAKTAHETKRLLVRHFVSQWAAWDIKEISRADILRVLDGLVEKGLESTANHAHAAIRKFFNWCVERGIVETSPCAGIKTPARKVARSRVLSDSELASIWIAASNQQHPFGDIIQLLILTGQRRSEVSEMRDEDLDLEESIWSIPPERNKSGRPHTIPLTSKTISLIQSIPNRPSGLLFPSRRTPERTFSGFSKCKKRLDEQSGVTDWTLHDIRRTVATGLARLEVPPHVVEKVLNHSTGTFAGVAGVYNRFGYLPEMREALTTWEAHVFSLLAKENQD